ncbi:serine threonine protein kinase [Stylonychia lemnae]|uniref:Serine threonine protein kinase n=1 Tax=Stylonychia lemnae TaxID=5949 RepID=A0A078AQ30_STYLE|nr:serine threonine protein kinase [Stylonychia lemnae]|eukprot:CDW84076.1 serine threonine protein kinase [Stylonychia lemnae]
MIAQLSKLVKKVGEQQKELILEFSQQLNQHNELIEKAMEKQERMEQKINRIETRLMDKEIYHYKENQEKVQQRKQSEIQRRRQREDERKHSEQMHNQYQQQMQQQQNQSQQESQIKRKDLQIQVEDEKEQEHDQQQQLEVNHQDHLPVQEHEEDGFESCDEDDSHRVYEKTGDPLEDYYLQINTIKVKENRKYIREGMVAMHELMELIKPDGWLFEKTYNKVDLYVREGNKTLVAFRGEARFDYPPDVVIEFLRNIDLRVMWDGQNFESINKVKDFGMETYIYYVRLKQQWPLGNRDLLLLFQGWQSEDGTIYLASKLTQHPDHPEIPKIIRVDTRSGSYAIEPLNEGKCCKMTYITEFDFRGSIPRYIIQKAGQASYIDSMGKLRKLLDKLHPDQKYNP